MLHESPNMFEPPRQFTAADAQSLIDAHLTLPRSQFRRPKTSVAGERVYLSTPARMQAGHRFAGNDTEQL